jgi:hypothetical protein
VATVKDYRTLTNDAMRESGATLTDLTTTTFVSTTEDLPVKFKQWVLQAYREIQMERQSWEPTYKEVYKILRPRMRVYANAGATPTTAAYLRGLESASTNQAVQFVDFSAAWAAGSVGNIEFVTQDNPYKFGEMCDRNNSAGTQVTANYCIVLGYGLYNLQAAFTGSATATTVFEPDKEKFFLGAGTNSSDALGSVFTFTSTIRNKLLSYMPWQQWVDNGFEAETSAPRGEPVYFTENPEGLYDFYPRPDTQYRLSYWAQQAIEELSGSTPTATQTRIPADFQDAIIWRAVMYYAEHDRKPELFQIASRRYVFYKTRMEDLLMPQVTWGRNQYC